MDTVVDGGCRQAKPGNWFMARTVGMCMADMISPDGRYVLFTGNMQEDGDPGNAGAPMGLMRLSDAPIIGGESRELRRIASAR